MCIILSVAFLIGWGLVFPTYVIIMVDDSKISWSTCLYSREILVANIVSVNLQLGDPDGQYATFKTENGKETLDLGWFLSNGNRIEEFCQAIIELFGRERVSIKHFGK